MSKDITRVRCDCAVCDELHPRVYQAVVGLVLWLVLSAVVLFGGWPDTELMFGIVAVFFFVLTAIPIALWLAWRKATDATRDNGVPLRDWTSAEFVTCEGRLRGSEAAAQVLLPIASVAFGITAFGLVAHFTLS